MELKTMTETEKAAAGFLYDANDVEFVEKHYRAVKLCARVNRLLPHRQKERLALFRQLLGRIAGEFYIASPFLCGFGCNIEIGEQFYANFNCVILDNAKVKFGNHVFVAPNCSFYTAGHPFDINLRNQGLEYALPISVGNDVWIGGNVIVLPGVTIGDGGVIGAGSVVTKDIPPGILAAGNPCRVLRTITEADRNRYRLYSEVK